MLIIISPAKTFKETQLKKKYEALVFEEKTQNLIEVLKQYEVKEVEQLMKVSTALASKTCEAYKQFNQVEQGGQALFSFNGEAYKGLAAESLSREALQYLDKHLFILSGLYGVIKPLAYIKPYRLEMGTKISFGTYKNLYAFWKEPLTAYFNEALKQTTGEQVLLNLASEEYSKAIDFKKFKAPVIEVSFKEYKAGTYKVVGMYAKKARGKMVHYLSEQRAESLEAVKAFNLEGYTFNEALSSATHYVFTR